MGNSSAEVKRAWALRNKHRITGINRHSRMRRDYGITPERFHEMYEEQSHKCAICLTYFQNESEAFIDHDHSTGWVRGLLCSKCNAAIGLLDDDAKLVNAAADYLILNVTPPEFVFQRVPLPPRKSNADAERTSEWRSNMSEARKGKEPWNKGKEWSDETKKKMSEAAKKRGLTEEGKAHRARLAELARKG